MDRIIDEMITQDPYMLSVKKTILQIASAESPVLIIGESGTGKDLAARAIHEEGKHSRGPFVVFHCAARPDEQPSDLLRKQDSGTLFLENVEETSTEEQARLAHLLEQEAESLPRIIASTRTAEIRDELLYLLSVNVLHMLPLRERRQDIPALADYYISGFDRILGRKITGLTGEATELLTRYDWPGNVRELRSVIEGAFNLTTGTIIGPEHLPQEIRGTGAETEAQTPAEAEGAGAFAYDDTLTYQENLIAMERQFLRSQLERFDSKKEIAEHFGMSKQTLNYKLNKLGLKNL